MKVVLSHLQEYLQPKLSLASIVQALESAGIEVDEISKASQLHKKIVIASVLSVAAHPNANKLKLVRVNDGKSEHQIVCGAGNVREGMKTALALPGAVLPEGQKIGKSILRGIESAGMLCSQAELKVGDDDEGIWDLPDEATVGQSISDWLGEETVVHITTAANRSDLTGLVGIAREVATHSKAKLISPELDHRIFDQGKLDIVGPEAVPRYILAELSIQQNQASPHWMQDRLRLAGQKPINLVVDITNYCLLELGHPLHAFDADTLKGVPSVRFAKKSEQIIALDDRHYSLKPSDLVVADKRGPIAIAGVIGGSDTGVTNKTKRIFLEAAVFDPVSVRKTALSLGIRTEASARFERALPVQSAAQAMQRAIWLLENLAGAKVTQPIQDNLLVWPWVQHIGMRASRFNKISGLNLTAQKIELYLLQAAFTAEKFDIVAEAKKHLGKPYIFGASYKTHGAEAFDCSYLIDYIYSLIGVKAGHTAYEQYQMSQPVELSDLVPGDLLFRDGVWVKLDRAKRGGIAHDAIYIGDGKIVHAREYDPDGKGGWLKADPAQAKVVEQPLETITSDPSYVGARRMVENLDDFIAVTVPWWRPDIKIEEDLIEEVVKLVGLDKISAQLPPFADNGADIERTWSRIYGIKSVLSDIGLFEVNTYSFIGRKDLALFDRPLKNEELLRLSNPRSPEQAYLRSDLLPSLLATVKNNENHYPQWGAFELSKVFSARPKSLPNESQKLAVIYRAPESAYWGVKQALDVLSLKLNTEIIVDPTSIKDLHPQRSAKIKSGKQSLGVIGEVDPRILSSAKLGGSVGYFELDIDLLLAASTPKLYQPISKFPSAKRDLAIVVDGSVSWAQIHSALMLEKLDISRIEYLNEYYGPELAGRKSVAFRMEFSRLDTTLTDEEIVAQMNKIMARLKQMFKAVQR